jgi:hypothetical protein
MRSKEFLQPSLISVELSHRLRMTDCYVYVVLLHMCFFILQFLVMFLFQVDLAVCYINHPVSPPGSFSSRRGLGWMAYVCSLYTTEIKKYYSATSTGKPVDVDNPHLGDSHSGYSTDNSSSNKEKNKK